MEHNPYAPPSAVVADLSSDADETDPPVFFPVSLIKLVVLSFCTLGLYGTYWFYKNWRIIRDRTHEDIRPVWRAIFAIFFCYQLFEQVRNYIHEPPTSHLPAGFLATTWIVLAFLWRLPDPYWLVSLVLPPLVLVPVQHAINRINRAVAPRHEPNSRFTAWNWVTTVLGGLLLVLTLIGTLLPVE